MVDKAMMKAILDKLAEADNAIGRDIAARLGLAPASDAPTEVLIAVATAHMIAAQDLIRLAGGSRLVAAIFNQQAEKAANEMH